MLKNFIATLNFRLITLNNSSVTYCAVLSLKTMEKCVVPIANTIPKGKWYCPNYRKKPTFLKEVKKLYIVKY